MRWLRGLLMPMALLVTVAPAPAHPVPFSYLDLHLAAPGSSHLDGTLVIHIFDLAHDLQVDAPERNLDAAAIQSRLPAIQAMLAARFRLGADDATLTPAWFPALRIAHAGDIFSGKNLPLLDVNAGGTGLEIGGTLEKAHAGIANVDAVIPGHSVVMPWADLGEYARFNKDFLADVEAGLKAGKTPDEIAAAWKISDKYKGYNIQAARLKSNVQAIADELKK